MTDLYKAGEMVQCFCTKCGWYGEAAAPTFACGCCGKYVAAPLDRDKRRANAAEAMLSASATDVLVLISRSQAAEARVAELEMALDFYADPETYLAIGFFPDPPCGEFMEDWSDTGKELGWRPGKRARAALQREPSDGL